MSSTFHTSSLVAALVVSMLATHIGGLSIQEQVTLKGSEASGADRFGSAVDIDGDRAVIGSEGDDVPVRDTGAAYVFERGPDGWRETAILRAADPQPNDFLGTSVGISGDTVAVGSSYHDSISSNEGAVYVFRLVNGTWAQEAKLYPPDISPGDSFGYSLAVDGDTLVVGAPNDDIAGSTSGSVRVYSRTGSQWALHATLVAPDTDPHDSLGVSVDLHGDTLIAGAYATDFGGARSGSAYIFKRDGETWTYSAKLEAPDAGPDHRFGYAVAVHGAAAIVGAHRDNDPVTWAGSAHVFRQNDMAWEHEAKLTANDAAERDFFGFSVDIDGDLALVGAVQKVNGNQDSGAVYAFQRQGNEWTELQRLTPEDPNAGDGYGEAIAIDDGLVLAGSKRDGAGSVFVFAVDSDEDGLVDRDEARLGTDPSNPDTDGDGVLDGAEVHNHGTDPLDADTDDDLYGDGQEVTCASDPADATSFPTPVGEGCVPPDQLEPTIQAVVLTASTVTESAAATA